jgi:SAM-dependent methyltransferase
MKGFVERFLGDRRGTPMRILDVGSQDINGSYRPLFDDPHWVYLGADLGPGKNVDIVLRDPYRWVELQSARFDLVVSGQTLEHVEFFWLTMLELERILRPGGWLCLLVPSRGYEHRYPVDCWRFYPDGIRALGRYAGLDVLLAETQWERRGYTVDDSDEWGDTLGVLRKPERRRLRDRLTLSLRRRLHQAMLGPW